MNMKRGFTVVEVLITLVIMAILLTLGVVSLRGMQANARDKERQTDIETMARGLERRYNEGNPVAVHTTNGVGQPVAAGERDTDPGRYPSTLEMWQAIGFNVGTYTPSQPGAYLTKLMPGVSDAATEPPTPAGWLDVICIGSGCDGKTPESASALDPHFGPSTGTTTDKYVYEPLTASGAFCGSEVECVRFNLYWYSEVSNSVQKVKSKHQ